MTQLIERDEILLCWMETRTRLETHLQLSPLTSCLLLTILFSEHSLWLGISPSDVFVGNYITLLQYCIGNAVISWLTPIISDFQISCDLIVPISLEIGWHAKLSRKSTSAVGCALAGFPHQQGSALHLLAEQAGHAATWGVAPPKGQRPIRAPGFRSFPHFPELTGNYWYQAKVAGNSLPSAGPLHSWKKEQHSHHFFFSL